LQRAELVETDWMATRRMLDGNGICGGHPAIVASIPLDTLATLKSKTILD
jgi:hypothetical protein